MSLPSRGTRSAPGPDQALPLVGVHGAEGARPGRPYEGTKTQEYQYDGLGLDLIRIADAQNLTTTPEEADEQDLLRKATIEDSRVKVIKPRSHEHDETNGIDILYANGRVFSSLNQNKGLTIYATDSLGSVRFTTNSRGSNTDEFNYDAFGQSLGKKPELFGYNGKVYDAVTSNYDYGFRDYAPRQARFTTVDPIQDGNNWYAYVNNDPVNLTDPDGLISLKAADGTTVNTSDAATPKPTIDKNTLATIATLNPAIRESATQFVVDAKNAGVDLRVTSGLRTMDEQTALYNQGRDKDGKVTDKASVVTNAKAGESYHNYGLAFDVAIVKNGKNNWDFNSSDWKTAGEVGKANGFEWGNDWTGFKDPPHFQNTFGLTTAELKKQYDSTNGQYVDVKSNCGE